MTKAGAGFDRRRLSEWFKAGVADGFGGRPEQVPAVVEWATAYRRGYLVGADQRRQLRERRLDL